MNTNIPTPANTIKDQQGSIMLEFAGSLIVLLILYLGMVTLGLRIDESISLQKVVRDGTREVAITGSFSQGEAKARESAWVWGLDADQMQARFSSYNYGSRKLIHGSVQYVSTPFSRLFPTLVEEKPVAEKTLKAEAVYGWWDGGN